MIAGHVLEMPLPLPCCRRPAGCTSVSGEPSYDRKTAARIVRRRNDEPSQNQRGTAVPPRLNNRRQILFNRLLPVHALQVKIDSRLRAENAMTD